MAVRVGDDRGVFNHTTLGPLFRVGRSLGPNFVTRYDATRDGLRFIVAEPEPVAPGPPGTVLLNWTTRLSR
jgi:hypothetical protein